jgi:hypothetical protein
MKQTVTESMFVDSFPESYKNNFSYEGKKALFEYLEELEDSTFEHELDPIALCCEYSEYITAVDCISDCDYDCDYDQEDPDDQEDYCLDWLQDQTQVIEHEAGIIIACF